ncbi:NmrA family NAD(P)-binding protein [Leptolyngbya sp. FACHB-36]|uniref:SDR family oxidoreductase n=1 Tax=Leptolyngbya sp. FACHB-36 TaxID=2692808 RepID=UPI00168167DA|nr:NmrA family NAD(P)-binding protein [Leptolyngbya sp. FACHB-36]MBD2019770.1 NmrA family NAD(P)-binding protein [Leptolyngbya sp. FACHB-36]
MSNSSAKILVYGATGAQGIPVVRKLLQKGYDVRVFVRDRDKAHSLFSNNVEIAVGTLENRESLKQANEGIDRVFLVLPMEYRFDVATAQGYNTIDAARAAGVNLLVFNTSTFIPQQITNAAAFEIKRKVEQYLHQSGVPNIIMRPPIYMDNLAAPWSAPSIVHQSSVAYPLPKTVKTSWISLDDAASLAVAALERPELAGTAFDIGGPEALSGEEIAEQFLHVFHRPFTYQEIPIDGFEQGLNQAFGEPVGTEIANIYRWRAVHLEDGAVDMTPVLRQLPVQLTTFQQWIQAADWATN